MLSLPEFQRTFARAVFDAAAGLEPEIAGTATRGFSVYRRTVFANLRGTLEGVYPVVLRLVGPEFFASAATAFVKAVPSRSGDLHRFGVEFPEFLSTFPPAAALPYLPDVARLEWAVHEVFHAGDTQPFPFDELARVDPRDFGQLRLMLHPASRLMRSEYPVQRIWQVNQPQFAGDETVSLEEGGASVLVSRSGFEVRVHTLADAGYALLEALAEGRTLAEAIEAALAVDARADVPVMLQRAVHRNAIAGFFSEASRNEIPGGSS
jgi:hypothetical protein